MKTILTFIASLLLCACGTSIQTADGTKIQMGVLSSIQATAGKVTTKGGTTIAFSQTGYEGESVANTGITALGVAVPSIAALKSYQAAQATTRALNASNAATAQAGIAATTSQAATAAKAATASAAIGKGAAVVPITVNAP